MDAVELEKELWKINNELVKAGIKPQEYPAMSDAVAELVRRYATQEIAQSDICPGCGIKYKDPTGSYCSRCGRYHL